MKFKVLSTFISSILHGIEGKIHEMELDEPTAKMWVEHGLIEEVKDGAQDIGQEVTKAAETIVAAKETAPAQAPAEGTAPEVVNVPPENITTEQSTPVADPAKNDVKVPEDVTTDVNQ